jgi:hypothetical protein
MAMSPDPVFDATRLARVRLHLNVGDEAAEFTPRSAHTDIVLNDPRCAEETDESMRSGHSAFSIG